MFTFENKLPVCSKHALVRPLIGMEDTAVLGIPCIPADGRYNVLNESSTYVAIDNRYHTTEHPCRRNGEVPTKIEKLGRRRSIPGNVPEVHWLQE